MLKTKQVWIYVFDLRIYRDFPTKLVLDLACLDRIRRMLTYELVEVFNTHPEWFLSLRAVVGSVWTIAAIFEAQ